MLLYGHLDKQPEMVGWSEGLGPWTPVRRGDRLYGRGAADDGYAAFAALTAVEALQAQGVPHARCVILVETCEESGSADLPAYMDALDARIGTPEPRGVPRLGLRQLRPALDARRRSEAWSAASYRWRCWARAIHSGAQRDRPVELPDPAPAPVAPRGRAARGRSARATSTSRSRRRASSRRRRWPRRSATLGTRMPFVPGMRAARHRSDRAGPRSHLAAGARDHGRRRDPAIADGGQRPAAADRRQALAPRAADPRRAGRRTPAEGAARDRSAVRGARPVHAGDARAGLGRPAAWPPGSRGHSSGLHDRTSGGRRCPRAWEAPSRSWACSASGSPTRSSYHGRARPRIERPRAQRVPPPPDRRTGHRLRRRDPRRPPPRRADLSGGQLPPAPVLPAKVFFGEGAEGMRISVAWSFSWSERDWRRSRR